MNSFAANLNRQVLRERPDAVQSRWGTVLFTALVLFCWLDVFPVQAQTVAVFPFEDLSRGVNSVNLELTRYVGEELQAKGVDLVREDDVISFMAQKRVRWLGYMDTEHILLTKESLGADLLLFGTVIQKREKKSPAFGLSIYLVRTTDGRTVWSSAGGLSLADLQKLLGLNQPATLADLLPILVRNVMASWPESLEEFHEKPLIFDPDSGEVPPTLQIKGIKLSPRYVRPGEQVKCAVHMANEEAIISNPQVFIKVGSRVHLAQQSQDGLFYEASWTGSEIEKGIFREVGHEALNLAAKDLDPQFFEGVWTGAQEDNTYPVTLILRWPSGEQQIAFVGTYTVDSTPPDIDIFFKKGKLLEGIVTFSDKVLVLPEVSDPEPYSHWQIEVEDYLGRAVMGDEGDGRVPRNFYWDGNNFSGYPVEEGVYRMVLKVWDRAGNVSESVKEVAYRPHPPEMLIDVEKLEKSLRFQLESANNKVPLAFWRLEIWTGDGILLKRSSGQELPVAYEIPFGQSPENLKIEGYIMLRDVLGNQTQMHINDLYLLALEHENPEIKKTTDTEEKPEKDDDSWVWLSENDTIDEFQNVRAGNDKAVWYSEF